jgi:rod shape-determining protein MreD
MRFPRRRRRPARASNSQAARMPSGLTFRRRRPRSEPAGPAADRRPTRLSFRGPRRRRKTAASAQAMPRGLSFRRRNSRKATGGGTDRRKPGLSFRRPRAKRSGALLERLPRWLAPRGPRTAASETPADRPPRGLRLRRRKRAQAPGPPKRRTSIAARGLALRLAALGFAACMLQLLIVSQISILGVSADVTPLVVVAAGFLCGSLPGAVFGFAVGLFIDLAFVQVLGVSSLLFTLIGYGAGRLRELRAPAAPLTPLALGAGATALALTGYGAIEFMLGVNTPVSYALAGVIVETTLLNSLIAVPVYALTRRALLGALPTSERSSNTTPATQGGLSPLSRA